ncbi:MAG: DUF1552 domain-containing protein [Acidobacteria bacterium]|nr:DUF1552 domain-containing protein [Acidobacteriota bacterium]
MIVTKTVIPRRTVLRGVGTALALPLLDGMVPALTALTRTAAAPTKRLGVVAVPNGAPVEYWQPKTAGADFEWTPSLKALAPVRDRVLVMTNLDSVGAEPGRGTTHSQAASAFLTGARPRRTAGAALELGISMDQVAANAEGIGRETQLPSLELSLEGGDTVYGVSTCDGGFSCAYLNNSWANRTTPMPRETNPRIVFERLFGDVGSTSAEARRRRIEQQRSILDAVKGKVGHLETGLAPYDRRKLDEYLEAVRGIERRIQLAEQQADRELPAVESPAGIPLSYEEHARLMFDLMILAYQTDMTRVISFMVGREESGVTYPQIGVTEPHHPLSHHRDNPEKIEKLARINAYHMQFFSDFLVKMQSTPDGDGTLLDNVMVMYGSALRNSNRHTTQNLPILVAGGGGGAIKGGRHVVCPEGTPLTDLQYTMLAKLGVPVDGFSGTNGEIRELSEIA